MTPSQLERYFAGEKAESLLFVGVGLVAIAVAALCWTVLKRPLTSGLAWPLLLVGLIQVGVGGGVYLRTDRQVAELKSLLARDPAAYAAAEGPRMATVMRNFVVYRYTEIALLVIGLGLSLWAWRSGQRYWLGVGLGLVLQSGLMLVADGYAEARGRTYTEAIAAPSGR